MVDRGFNNQIGVHPETGFVFGGNDANCGTWMDKMGSSEKAKNKGVPTTPRDGSAVELVGLQAASLRFLQKLAASNDYPYKTVERIGNNGEKTVWTLEHWADLIEENFDRNFFVTPQSSQYVNKIGIYKDSVGATQPWTDYQLRCNFPIAMVAVSCDEIPCGITFFWKPIFDVRRLQKFLTRNTPGKHWNKRENIYLARSV